MPKTACSAGTSLNVSGDFGRGTEESFRQRGASIVLRGGGDGSSDAGNSAIASRSLPAEVAKCWHAALAQQPFEADGFDKPNADEQTRKAASAVHFSAASLSVSSGTSTGTGTGTGTTADESQLMLTPERESRSMEPTSSERSPRHRRALSEPPPSAWMLRAVSMLKRSAEIPVELVGGGVDMTVELVGGGVDKVSAVLQLDKVMAWRPYEGGTDGRETGGTPWAQNDDAIFGLYDFQTGVEQSLVDSLPVSRPREQAVSKPPTAEASTVPAAGVADPDDPLPASPSTPIYRVSSRVYVPDTAAEAAPPSPSATNGLEQAIRSWSDKPLYRVSSAVYLPEGQAALYLPSPFKEGVRGGAPGEATPPPSPAPSGRLELHATLSAFAAALKIAATFGPLMALAVQNDENNIAKIAAAGASLTTAGGLTLRDLLEAELASGLHTPGSGMLHDPSAALSLVWILRSLRFQLLTLEGMLKGNQLRLDEPLCNVRPRQTKACTPVTHTHTHTASPCSEHVRMN